MFHVKFNLLFVSHLIFISRYLFYLPACLSVSDDRISSPPSTSPRGFSSSSNICILLFLYWRKGDNTFVCTQCCYWKFYLRHFLLSFPDFFWSLFFTTVFSVPDINLFSYTASANFGIWLTLYFPLLVVIKDFGLKEGGPCHRCSFKLSVIQRPVTNFPCDQMYITMTYATLAGGTL